MNIHKCPPDRLNVARNFIWKGLQIGLLILMTQMLIAAESPPTHLNPQNTKVPFCYLAEGKRSWPILSVDLAESDRLTLAARRGDTVLATGESVSFEGVTVSTSPAGRLQVESSKGSTAEAFDLVIALETSAGEKSEQTLSLRPAPPARPITYIADLVDDFIHT